MGRILGFERRLRLPSWEQETAQVMFQQPLHRVLAFIGCTIDDVVNDSIVKNKVLGFYKLHKQVERGCEIVELERWWNAS
jgi:hypothetical protein